VGYQALYDATAAATGSDNVAIGRLAMGSSALTSGHTNIAIGLNALDAASTAFENIAIGKNAMGASTGPNNCIGIGQSAGSGISVGSDVIAIGINARSIGNSSDSVAIGADALQSGTGAGNVGVGASALTQATGSGNVGVGRSSGSGIAAGTDNVFVGEACGSSFGAASTTNVVIGHEGGGNVTGTSSGNVMIGNFAGPSTASVMTNRLFIDNQQRDEPFLGGDFSTLSVTMGGSLRLTERVDHILTPTATYGEIWVKNGTPNTLMFTDDAGTDWTLNTAGGGSIGGSITNDQIAVGAATADDIEGGTELTFVSGKLTVSNATAENFQLNDTSGTTAAATDVRMIIGGNGTVRGRFRYTGGDIRIENLEGPVKLSPGISSGTEIVEITKGGLKMKERADHAGTPTATWAELWLNDDAAQKMLFTDDAGADFVLNTVSETTTNLASITAEINTSASKHAGQMVWNSTTGAPVWAAGAADGSVWVDATGATAHTPV
jgi:hypothetical protein